MNIFVIVIVLKGNCKQFIFFVPKKSSKLSTGHVNKWMEQPTSPSLGHAISKNLTDLSNFDIGKKYCLLASPSKNSEQ